MAESIQVTIDSLIGEYLQHQGFSSTFSTFIDECKSKSRPLSSYVTETLESKIKDIRSQMMNFFDFGDAEKFFEYWKNYIPSGELVGENPGHKVEFYVYIYFAIFPVHPISKKQVAYFQIFHKKKDKKSTLEAGMTRFRKFIETKGSDLSNTATFLPFYALPFVGDPSSHPSFKELFQEEWANDLRVKLENFLSTKITIKEEVKKPQIFELLNQRSGNRSSEVSKEELTVLELQKKQLSMLAGELFDVLSKSARDKIVPSLDAVTKLASKLEGFIPIKKPVQMEQTRNVGITYVLAPLDFKKVQTDLISNSVDVNKKVLLLQALRWRISKSRSGQTRKAVVMTLTKSDFLGLKTKDNIVKSVMATKNEILIEYLFRLLNTLASEYIGRTYLIESNEIIPLLVKMINSENNDTISRQQGLATIQKLSLRRKAQEKMIELEIIKWLAKCLSELEGISIFTLEYSTALLMNLSLRTAGKQKCEKLDIISVLSDLLEHENPRVKTYVNGALYSLLTVPSLKEKARSLGMDELLKYLMKNSDENFKEQFGYILKQLNSSLKLKNKKLTLKDSDNVLASHVDFEDDEHDDDDSAIVLEEDEAESLIIKPGTSQGEELLCSGYLANEKDASVEVDMVKKSLEFGTEQFLRASGRINAPLARPTTPSRVEPLRRSSFGMEAQEDMLQSPKLQYKIDAFNGDDMGAFKSRPKVNNSVTELPKHSATTNSPSRVQTKKKKQVV